MAAPSIGTGSAGSGQLLARPVVAEGRVFTMDARGRDQRVRRADRQPGVALRARGADADEAELGGGLAYDGGWLFATLSSGTVIGLNASSGTEVWRQSLAAAVARRADRRRRPSAGGQRRQSALRPGRRDRPADVAACRLLRGHRPARRPEPGGRRQRRGRALLVGRGVRAAPRQRPPLVERHRAAPAPHRGRSPRSTTSTACR